MSVELICDLSSDKTTCHFSGMKIDDVLLQWWGIPLVVGVFFILAIPEIIVLFKHSWKWLSCRFIISFGLRFITLLLESWAIGSSVVYLVTYPFPCDYDGARTNCFEEQECLDNQCDSFEQSPTTLDLMTVLVFAIVSYIPKLMAACARKTKSVHSDFEETFWHLVSDRGCCWSGWILVVLPYITAIALVLNTLSLCTDCALNTGWQDALEILIRIGTSLVIGFLGIWTFYLIILSLCKCCQDMDQVFAVTIKIMQICELIIDIFAALLLLGSFFLGSMFVTADAILLLFSLVTTFCCDAGEDDDSSYNSTTGTTRGAVPGVILDDNNSVDASSEGSNHVDEINRDKFFSNDDDFDDNSRQNQHASSIDNNNACNDDSDVEAPNAPDIHSSRVIDGGISPKVSLPPRSEPFDAD